MAMKRLLGSLALAAFCTVSAIGAQPAPPAAPQPTPTANPATISGNRQLVGGWRFPFNWQRGAIAIDFTRMKLWMAGHAQQQVIDEYDLPPMGTGDEATWPVVSPVGTLKRFWSDGNVYGLAFFRGKLWVAPRAFYAQESTIDTNLTLYASDGETIRLRQKMQVFAGFVKRGPGEDPLIGGGGYESGQGTVSGPTLATLDGKVIITYAWPETPGGGLRHWNSRAPRDPNFTVGGVAKDSWVGWEPRVVNGKLEGRWASDRIYAGGLVLPEGVTYWPWMATGGPLDYGHQTYTFVPDKDNRTYEYRYTPDGKFVSYQQRPALGVIAGQELGPDGTVYLIDMGLGWLSGPGTIVLKAFR
jgi:hypothetical protein